MSLSRSPDVSLNGFAEALWKPVIQTAVNLGKVPIGLGGSCILGSVIMCQKGSAVGLR